MTLGCLFDIDFCYRTPSIGAHRAGGGVQEDPSNEVHGFPPQHAGGVGEPQRAWWGRLQEEAVRHEGAIIIIAIIAIVLLLLLIRPQNKQYQAKRECNSLQFAVQGRDVGSPGGVRGEDRAHGLRTRQALLSILLNL